MIPSFISINTSYLKIMYSLSENLKIWNPLGSKSVYLPFLWRDVLFICVFGDLFELIFAWVHGSHANFIRENLCLLLLLLKLALSTSAPSENPRLMSEHRLPLPTWHRTKAGAPDCSTALSLCPQGNTARPICLLLPAHDSAFSSLCGWGLGSGLKPAGLWRPEEFLSFSSVQQSIYNVRGISKEMSSSMQSPPAPSTVFGTVFI